MSSALRLAWLHHTHQKNKGQDCKGIEGNRQLPLLLGTQLWNSLLAPPRVHQKRAAFRCVQQPADNPVTALEPRQPWYKHGREQPFFLSLTQISEFDSRPRRAGGETDLKTERTRD